MSENVGGIYYSVTADTSKLVGQTRVVERETGKMAASFTAVVSAIKLYAAALALVKSAQMADEMRLLAARVQVAAGSIEAAATAMAGLQAISLRTQTSVAANVQVFTRLNASLRQMGGTQADTLRVTELLGMAVKVSGASAAEASSAMTQFGQALGSGKLAGDELRSLLENAPYLMQQLADGLGVGIGALKSLGEQGKLTADVVVGALSKAADTITADFAKLPQTLGGAWQTTVDAMSRLVEELDDASGSSMVLTGISKGLGETMDALARQIDATSDASDKLGRNDGIETWASRTKTALSFVLDAADFVYQQLAKYQGPIERMVSGMGKILRDYGRVLGIGGGGGADAAASTVGERMRAQWDTEGWAGPNSGPNRGRAIPGGKLTTPASAGAGKAGKKDIPYAITDPQADMKSRFLQSEKDFEAAQKHMDEMAAKAAENDKRRAEQRQQGEYFALATIAAGDPVAQLEMELMLRSAKLDEYAAADLANAQLYADAKVALEQQTADKIAELRERDATRQQQLNVSSVAMLADMTSQMYSILQQSGRERSALAKALFLVTKGLAVAEILMNTEIAAAKVKGQLGIFGFAAESVVRASGYASAAMVGGMAVGEAISGRQYGGPVSSGSLYRVNEGGAPEMFTAANGSQYMMPTRDGRVVPAGQGGSAVAVNVHNYAGVDVQTTASDDGRTIDIAVRRAVAEVADSIASHSGQPWQALRASTNVAPRL